jgi:hypothetical protein
MFAVYKNRQAIAAVWLFGEDINVEIIKIGHVHKFFKIRLVNSRVA